MATAVVTAPPESYPRKLAKLLRDGDQIVHLVTLIFAASVFVVTVFLVYELWIHSGPSRAKFGFGFLTGRTWDAVTEQFGALPFIYGTVLTSFIALLISVPLGVGAAIFLAELAPPTLSNACTFLVELLAAVPSVILGLLAFFTLVPLMRQYVEPFLKDTLGFLPWFQGPVYGLGYLTASIALATMTFPFVISISREALLAVPREQREAALALGATKWESTWQVVVPFARLGIIGSVFLALARALGETMVVTMVIGNDTGIHTSLLSPGYTIAAVIANEFSEATGEVYLSSLVELGLVLFALTMVLNAAAQLLIIATTRKGSRQD
jgi:phosphate transport system permease protein